jgi:DNA-binding NarL/FixJ family response regulator
MIKVMIVDDQKIFKEGLRMILNQDNEIDVVGLCENGQEAVDLVSLYNPDIILMDIQMPIMNGVDAVKYIKENNKEIDIIMLTTFHDDKYIYDAIKNGASGYLLKDTSVETIISAIKIVYHGGALINPEVTKILLNQFTKLANNNGVETDVILKTLTNREVEISKLISEGMNNKEISKRLFLSEGTVKNHLTRILQKLELRDRTQLAIFIIKNKN